MVTITMLYVCDYHVFNEVEYRIRLLLSCHYSVITRPLHVLAWGMGEKGSRE